MDTTRRSLLKGLTLGAGAAILNPLISQLEAHADGSEVKLARFLFVVLPNGLPAEDINPVGFPLLPHDKRTGLVAEAVGERKLHTSMAAVQKHAAKVTIVQGLSGTCSDAPGSDESAGGHSKAWGALGAYKAINGYVPAATIDAALGNKLGGLFNTICLGVSQDPATSVVYDLSASGAGRKIPTMCQPAIAYKALFGSVAGGQAAKEFAVKTNLLDFLADDVRALRGAVGSTEREKLDAHLNAYEAMRGRQAKFETNAAALRKVLPEVTDKFTSPVETHRLAAQFDLAAAALAGGLTHAVTISCAAGRAFDQFTFKGLGIERGLHGIGHSSVYADYQRDMAIIRAFLFERIADVMEKLAAIPEGSGTMLDNTLVAFTSDFGDSHHASRREWPFVLIGSLGGRLKAGQVIVYPPFGAAGHKSLNALYTTLMYTVGERPKTFGVPDLNLKGLDLTGPLSELLA